MRKTIVAIATAVILGTTTTPALAHPPGVFYIPTPTANKPAASGIVGTGRLIGTATGKRPVGVGQAPVIRTICQMQVLSTNRYGRGVMWTNVPLGGPRVRANRMLSCVWIQPLESGRYRLRARTQAIYPNGAVKYGKWAQSRAISVYGW